MKYTNPVLPGFHPAPRICRVGSDFYLVTSSFTTAQTLSTGNKSTISSAETVSLPCRQRLQTALEFMRQPSVTTMESTIVSSQM